MNEIICTEGHVMGNGVEICARCGGSAPVEAVEAPVEVAEEVVTPEEVAPETEEEAENVETSEEKTA